MSENKPLAEYWSADEKERFNTLYELADAVLKAKDKLSKGLVPPARVMNAITQLAKEVHIERERLLNLARVRQGK